MPVQPDSDHNFHAQHDYLLEGITIPTLTDSLLAKHSSGLVSPMGGYVDIQPLEIGVNQGSFASASRVVYFPSVSVKQMEQSLLVSCTCGVGKDSLC